MTTSGLDDQKLLRVTLRSRSWAPLPPAFTLADDEIYVWRVDLSSTTPRRVESLRCILAEHERRKADGFCFAEDRVRYTVARGMLRVLLGRYLDLKPAQVNFRYGPHGKPALAARPGEHKLRFNVSHSRELILFALARGREVGIDIEYIRPDLALEEIAARYFSPQEAATLRSLPAEVQPKAFFAAWTRKEAYIKARGEGLSLALDGFSVSLVPGEPAMLLNTREGPSEAARWTLRELNAGRGYAAALAAEGRDWHLVRRHWPE